MQFKLLAPLFAALLFLTACSNTGPGGMGGAPAMEGDMADGSDLPPPPSM